MSDIQADEIQVEEIEVEEIEVKALEQGWSPEEEWRGDPDKWVDAKTFIERGEKNNAILKERNDRLIEEVQSLKRELRESVKTFGDASRKAEERAYAKAVEDLKRQQMAAVSEGDTAEWARLEKEKEGLQEEFEKSSEPEQYNPDNDPIFKSWHQDNNWYLEDVEKTAYAEQIAPIIARRHGNRPTRAFYDEIASEVKKKFASSFRNTNRDMPGAVQRASESGGKPKRGKGYSDLPPEAKAACDKFVKQKILTKEQYVKDYFGADQ